MPLIHSPSKKALGKNIETEMKANPSPEKRKQNIAIAYSVKRQAMKKKKMAEGGDVTANEESMTGNSADDASTTRDMAMEMGKRPSTKDEDDEATHESMMGNSIDDAMDSREMEMTKPKKVLYGGGEITADSKDDMEMRMMRRKKMYKGGEITANDESMAQNSIDDSSDPREMTMLDSKPTRHGDELLARNMGHPDEDSEDSMEMGMLHAKGQPDEYSKAGIINYAKGGSVADGIMRKRKMMADGGEVDLQDSNGDEHLNEEDQLSFQAPRKKTYYDLSQMGEQPEDSNEHTDQSEMDSHDEHDMIKNIRLKMKKSGMI